MDEQYYSGPFVYSGYDNICVADKSFVANCAGSVSRADCFVSECVRSDFYLMYSLGGRLEMYQNGAKSFFDAGNLIIFPPGTLYKYINNSGGAITYLWLHFTGYDAQNMIDAAGIPLNKIHNIGLHIEIAEYFKRLFNEFMFRDKNLDIVCKAISTQLLTHIGRYVQNKKQAYRLLRSIEYIHKNYNENITPENLAEIEHISPAYYRTVFKQIMGISPCEYITAHRIKAASGLLNDRSRSISDIAAAVGYSDPFYFSRIFKKKTGLSPHEYRLTAAELIL